jgi:16S rRNA (cytosine1402-N4)-methyltransferase
VPQHHEPVMVREILGRLPGGDVVLCDGTLGTAGHGLAVLRHLAGRGTFIGLDRDPEMLGRARQRVDAAGPWGDTRIELEACRYEDLPAVLARHGIPGVDGMILDLGVNSLHLDLADRGFSFTHDGPLDGRFNREETGTPTVAELVNTASEEDLARWIHELSDERHARRIARRIVEARAQRPFETTHQLAQVVEAAYPAKERGGRIHPATRTFQALRIVANDELGSVERGLRASMESLNPGGVLCVLSYHSKEDRITKRLFDEAGSPRPDPGNLYEATTRAGLRFEVESRGAIKPSDEEVAANPRARSARLRVLRRLEVAA